MEIDQDIRKNESKELNFHLVLQNELLKRCRLNPSYSLRAFARSLKIEPSSLSQILNKKRPLTHKMKLRLGSALGYSVDELKAMPVSPSKYQQIDLDTFALISDWYNFAILELTHLKEFVPDLFWIAKRIGITKQEANISVDRLFRLNLLKKNSAGEWKDNSEDCKLTQISPNASSEAARSYQRQLLRLSDKSVQEVPLNLRNHTSATLCFDTDDLPRAIESITQFRRKFSEEFQPKDKGNEVYQVQISFFPLTKNIIPEEDL